MTEHLMTWVGPGLDVATVVLLAAVLWRFGREPGAAWRERETRLQTIFDELRAVVAQSEGLARDLDEKLAAREARLRALVGAVETAIAGSGVEPGSAQRSARPDARAQAGAGETPVTVGRAASASAAASDTAGVPVLETDNIADRIETLAEGGTAVEEIARRVGVAAAEVRLVIGLKAARAARRRGATTEAGVHA